MPKPCAWDIMIYVYKDSAPLPRSLRLAACARRYARWRGILAGDFTVATAPGGKPYFPHEPALHFSVSHSGEYWAVAFSGQPLGLDIQRYEERDQLALAKRWYHPEEYAAVKKNGPACFFDIWSAKESLVKCSGEGVSSSFSSFCVVENGEIAPISSGWQIKPLSILDGYAACLCGKKLGQVYVVRAAPARGQMLEDRG